LEKRVQEHLAELDRRQQDLQKETQKRKDAEARLSNKGNNPGSGNS